MSADEADDVGALYAAVDMSKKKKKSVSTTTGPVDASKEDLMEDVGDVSAAEGNLAVYAAVDKSKKKKKRQDNVSMATAYAAPIEEPGVVIEGNCSVYTAVDESTINQKRSLYTTAGDAAKNDEPKGGDHPFTTTKSEGKFESIPTEGFASSKNTFTISKFKAMLCVIIVLAVCLAVMTLICFVLSVYAGTKIAGLESVINSSDLQTTKDNSSKNFMSESDSNCSCQDNFNMSCAALPSSFPSGYYVITAFNGSAVRAYCDMTRSCGNVTGGWTRVAYLNMADTSQQCPNGFRQHLTPRACVANTSIDRYGCFSTVFPVNIPYSEVCGRVTGYQIGTTNAFSGSTVTREFRRGNRTINDTYVDGVSLTYGHPRQHIWTFAAGVDRAGEINSKSICPCHNSTLAAPPPGFIMNNYFCDTGFDEADSMVPLNRLWDGRNCTSSDPCCSFNRPPWFHRVLSPTAEDIEMRVCRDEGSTNEDIAIERVELYVQ